jgi:acetate kinase
MKLLVLNAGSGSQRCSLFELPNGPLPSEPMEPCWEAKRDATEPDQPKGKIRLSVRRGGDAMDAGLIAENASVVERTEALLRALWDGSSAVISDPSEIDVVAHRVVHGGGEFKHAVRIDPRV